jgi:hypothetical protein
VTRRSTHQHDREMRRKALAALKRKERLERRKARRERGKGLAVEADASLGNCRDVAARREGVAAS